MVVFLVVLFSCSSQPRESLILGRWQYDKTGKMIGKETNWEFIDENKDFTMMFNKDGSMVFNLGHGENYKGFYKLINNSESIVTEVFESNKKDTTNILYLSSDILKVQTHDTTVVLQLKKSR